jgi:nucleoside-diphosphate-sugar epimerase
MRVLVTGGGGFLGRHVVAELTRRGHSPRVLMRPATSTAELGRRSDVEVVHGDLRAADSLRGVAAGVETVVHLATPTTGDPEDGFTTAVVGTEHLFEALRGSPVSHVVLAGSVAVYDWSRARGTVTEDSPLVDYPWRRDGYVAAKLWQERVARRCAAELGIALTVLRPGFIWGPGRESLSGTGLCMGAVHLVVTGRHRLPATHVENCAHCFATVVEDERARGRVYNVVDGRGISPWSYVGAQQRAARRPPIRIPLPYMALRGTSLLAGAVARTAFEHGGRLPSALDPPRSQARFKPVEWSAARLRRELGWQPPLSFGEAAARTFGS